MHSCRLIYGKGMKDLVTLLLCGEGGIIHPYAGQKKLKQYVLARTL